MSKTSPKLKIKVVNTKEVPQPLSAESKIEEILNDKVLMKQLMKRAKNESVEPKKRGRKPLNMSEEEKKELIKERQKQYRAKYKAEFELWNAQVCDEQKNLIYFLQKNVVDEDIIDRMIRIVTFVDETPNELESDGVLDDGREK